ncbi:MAG: LysR family transcriptional regulator [Rhodobacterales bacterium]|nr:MAG: LysR family transcriptional regulator [Rhodobacterales bacterium]
MTAPRRLLPAIPALQALEAVGRLGSATAAAQELSLTQSAVSRQLQGLESQLGVKLFQRKNKRLVLTGAGERYAEEIRTALHQIAQASLRVTTNPGGGAVNLAILPTFGMRWLVPRLPRFAEQHPDITINMTTRLNSFNFDTEPFDAALHFGKGDWPNTEKMKLLDETVVPVANPDLLAGMQITGPRDLLRLPLLHIQTRPRAWEDWFARQGVESGRTIGTFHDQFSTIIQAALHGLGVALLPEYLVERELIEGRLKIATGGPVQSLGAYWLIWPDTKSEDRALAAFRDWLKQEVANEDMLPR